MKDASLQLCLSQEHEVYVSTSWHLVNMRNTSQSILNANSSVDPLQPFLHQGTKEPHGAEASALAEKHGSDALLTILHHQREPQYTISALSLQKARAHCLFYQCLSSCKGSLHCNLQADIADSVEQVPPQILDSVCCTDLIMVRLHLAASEVLQGGTCANQSATFFAQNAITLVFVGNPTMLVLF